MEMELGLEQRTRVKMRDLKFNSTEIKVCAREKHVGWWLYGKGSSSEKKNE